MAKIFEMFKHMFKQPNYSYDDLVPEGSENISFEDLFSLSKIDGISNINTFADYLDEIRNAKLSKKELSDKVIEFLRCKKMSINGLFNDAVKKDTALDTYEMFLEDRMLRKQIKIFKKWNAMENAIQGSQPESAQSEDITLNGSEELKDAIRDSIQNTYEDKKFFNKWLKEKTALEEKLASACKLLGDESIVTVGCVSRGEEGRPYADEKRLNL